MLSFIFLVLLVQQKYYNFIAHKTEVYVYPRFLNRGKKNEDTAKLAWVTDSRCWVGEMFVWE